MNRSSMDELRVSGLGESGSVGTQSRGGARALAFEFPLPEPASSPDVVLAIPQSHRLPSFLPGCLIALQ